MGDNVKQEENQHGAVVDVTTRAFTMIVEFVERDTKPTATFTVCAGRDDRVVNKVVLGRALDRGTIAGEVEIQYIPL